IAPGIVKTSMSEGFLSKMTVDQVRALEDTYPLGFGEPEDVAWMIEFLLSPRSRWVSGKTFLIDGGHLPGGK
ncbi:MAG TPA: SDR family oxidoreductase, partial [Thermotogota bacterium]|nr:SDR family oxidoreductase [Thermotogota bacterium]